MNKVNPIWKINTIYDDDYNTAIALPQLPEGFGATTITKAATITKEQNDTVKNISISQSLRAGVASFVSHPELSRFEQTVALINDDNCIRCGRCYASCNDNAYQAISMDPITRQVTVHDDKCTSCGICESVCPYPNTISFVPRPDGQVFTTYRGSDIKAEMNQTYPQGLLSDDVIEKFKKDTLQQQKALSTTATCQLQTCCGGNCQSNNNSSH
jgi:NAD-dependent dihydropyrimidine dehydrogenase PreA subunit